MAQVDLGPGCIPPSGANINPTKLLRLCWLVREDLDFITLRELLERRSHLHSDGFFRIKRSRNNDAVLYLLYKSIKKKKKTSLKLFDFFIINTNILNLNPLE